MQEKNNKSLLHAKHNDAAIKYIDRSPNHLDWVNTICFYSSLHYIRYYLFPISLKTSNAGSYKIDHFDEYCKHFKNTHLKLSKHEKLLNLVAKLCPDISYEYNKLMDMSSLARYTDYTADRNLSNLAKSFHKTIKEFCERKAN